MFPTTTVDGLLPALHVPAAFWSDFVGSGGAQVALLTAAGAGTYGGTSVPGVFFGGHGAAGADIVLEYQYEPIAAAAVPSPAAGTAVLALVTLAGGAGYVSKRRRVGIS
jgi:hypothetical protein